MRSSRHPCLAPAFGRQHAGPPSVRRGRGLGYFVLQRRESALRCYLWKVGWSVQVWERGLLLPSGEVIAVQLHTVCACQALQSLLLVGYGAGGGLP